MAIFSLANLGVLIALGGSALAAAASPPAVCVPPPVAALMRAGAPPANSRPGAVNLVFDGSGSMAGYLGPNTHIVPDLLDTLPLTAARRGERVTVAKFDRRWHDIDVSRSRDLADRASYRCPRDRPRKDCDSDASHIDMALDKAARSPIEDLTIIVTDMWLSNGELAQSGVVTLGERLTNLFEQGRSIGLIGVKAPYHGAITDIPPPGTPAYMGTSSHPIYLLLIGPVAQVEAYRQALATSGSTAFAGDGTNYSLFTNDAVRRDSGELPRLDFRRSDAALHADVVLPLTSRIAVQQMRLRPSAARGRAGAAIAARGFNAADSLRTGAVWQGEVSPRLEFWLLRDPGGLTPGRCNPIAWTSMGRRPGGWSGAGGARTLSVDPSAPVFATLRPGSYLVLASLERGSLQQPSPADAWVRQWSVSEADAAALAQRKPTFFPTLNLAGAVEVLESALQRSAAAKGPVPLTGTAFVIKVD